MAKSTLAFGIILVLSLSIVVQHSNNDSWLTASNIPLEKSNGTLSTRTTRSHLSVDDMNDRILDLLEQQDETMTNSSARVINRISIKARQQWCPQAHCEVTDLCHPCQRRFLVMIATGRSGSTTLQNMVNSLPGVRVTGENNGMLRNFMHAIDATRKRVEWKQGSGRLRWAWGHRTYPSQAFACVTQQMVETINPPANHQGRHLVDPDEEAATIVGFKTIRFPLDDSPVSGTAGNVAKAPNNPTTMVVAGGRKAYLVGAAEFLKESLPCARIVVNIRSELESQAASLKKSWIGRKHSLENVTKLVQQHNQELLDFAKLLGPERAFVLDSSKWTKDISMLNEMVSWLGFDEKCYFEEAFQFNTKGKYDPGELTERVNPPGCVALPG